MLRDVMQSSGLSVFAEAGLVIFMVTFLVVVWRVVSRQRGHYDAVSRLPLEDEGAEAPATVRQGVPESSGRGAR
jgi:hypothetical protein